MFNFFLTRSCSFSLILGIIVGILFVSASGWAGTQADFDDANRLYDQGDFAGARTAYQRLIDEESRGGNAWAPAFYKTNLFYNLGNAAFRQGDKPAAVLAYERALWLNPGLPEAKANLALLRQESGARLFTPSWADAALSWPSANTAAWLAAIAFWGLCLSLAPLLWKRPCAFIPAALCFIILAWGKAVVIWQASPSELYIITSATPVTARTAPAESATAVIPLPLGSHVRLLHPRGAWLHVQLPNQAEGWVPASAVSPVRML